MHGPDYIRNVFLSTFRPYYRLRGKIAFTLHPLVDYVLDRAGMKQSVNSDRTGLTTPIGTSTCLVLNRWIPFQVVVDHMVRSRDIEACSSSLWIQYQSRGSHDGSETIDPWLPIRNRCPSINHVTGDAVATSDVFVKNIGHLCIRSEDQNFL